MPAAYFLPCIPCIPCPAFCVYVLSFYSFGFANVALGLFPSPVTDISLRSCLSHLSHIHFFSVHVIFISPLHFLFLFFLFPRFFFCVSSVTLFSSLGSWFFLFLGMYLQLPLFPLEKITPPLPRLSPLSIGFLSLWMSPADGLTERFLFYGNLEDYDCLA